ncbi:MAG TPA: cyclic nucleotide-binding domain-containing protein [Pyrinomonadaceae bacterium]|nr:cyclic nucleotide-binding domain-containing protein [Pyrinomonadaceae bacterium]
MEQSGANLSINFERRLSLLASLSGFASLSREILNNLVNDLIEEKHVAKSVIVSEGDTGERLYIIAEGRAEVSVPKSGGAIPLAVLQAGEIFGEIALLSAENKRQASVVALTDTITLALSDAVFKRLLETQPETRQHFERAAEEMIETKFLKRASPFAKIEAARLRDLARKLKRVSVKAGENIVNQGDAGDACYFIFKGAAEVFFKDENDTEERRVAALGTGSLFGETALLTDAPRNATVRAAEDCEILILYRADLMSAMSDNREISGQMIELMHLRARPRRSENVREHQRQTADGETITILKDETKHTYFRLSSEGYFIWQRLDGRRSLRDLTLDYLAEFKSFSPAAIAGTIGGLTQAGFVETNSLRSDVLTSVLRLAWCERIVLTAKNILEYQKAWAVDAPVSALYEKVFHYFFTKTGQIFLALISLVGIAAFFLTATRAKSAFYEEGGLSLFLFLLPAYFIAILAHEAGHALTTKAFGFEVPRAGIGWYWFGPIAFVDTSDMWLGTRRQRIAVSLAGPYANLILGSAAALAAWFISSADAVAALWQFALISYFLALVNLNPLLEYDGYYVLMDWLERPNLRPRALAWLGSELPKVWRVRAELRAHLLEIIYGTRSLVYIVLMGVLTIVSYLIFFQDWMMQVVSANFAAALAWILGLVVIILSLLSVAGELRGTKSQPAK